MRFNNMNNLHKEKEAELEEKVREYEKLTAERYEELKLLRKEKEEYEEKLNTIRKAFEILGLEKEVK